jgi:hypothetical protein
VECEPQRFVDLAVGQLMSPRRQRWLD